MAEYTRASALFADCTERLAFRLFTEIGGTSRVTCDPAPLKWSSIRFSGSVVMPTYFRPSSRFSEYV